MGKVEIHNDYNIHTNCNCSDLKVEDIWLDITIGDTTYTICGVYRHPNGKIEHFIDKLEEIMEKNW